MTSNRSLIACGLKAPKQPAADVEARVLHRCEPALAVAAGGHAALHRLADGPVLSVHEIPEVGGIRAVTVRLLWRDEHIEDNAGTGGAGWMEDERRDVIGGKAEEQVGIDELTL